MVAHAYGGGVKFSFLLADKVYLKSVSKTWFIWIY